MLTQQARFVQRATQLLPALDAFLAVSVPVFRQIGRNDKRGRPPSHDMKRILAAIWTVGRTGGQRRSVELMCGLPFNTVHYHFLRLTRRGFWKRLAGAMVGLLRVFDGADPTVGSVDSQSVPSAPSAGCRGIDGAKKIKGVRLSLIVDKHSLPLAMRTDPANRGERAALLDLTDELRREWPSVGTLLADLGYAGKNIAEDLRACGLNLVTKKCGGADGKFRSTEIRWTVERAFAWIQSWRRTAVCYERDTANFEAFVCIGFASIIAAWLADMDALPST